MRFMNPEAFIGTTGTDSIGPDILGLKPKGRPVDD